MGPLPSSVFFKRNITSPGGLEFSNPPIGGLEFSEIHHSNPPIGGLESKIFRRPAAGDSNPPIEGLEYFYFQTLQILTPL